MHFTSLAAVAITALAPLASAVGNAKVHNNCAAPFYLWSVGSSVSNVHKINPGETFSEQFHRDAVTGGIALKITRQSDGLYNGSPQLIFAYTLDPSQVWYDLSTIFGTDFQGQVLTVTSNNEDCPTICWPDGTQPAGSQVLTVTSNNEDCPTICWPDGTQPAGSQVKTCEPNSDQTLTLCADECPA